MCDLHHLVFGAKVQTTSRACLNASRLKALTHAIRTQRAFVNFPCLLVELRNIERATGNAVTAADAIVLLKIDDAVFVLDNDPIGWTRAQATRIFAVHAW